ncbi:MAG TPA: phosphatase PAP2 family protein [Candidatus Paceibacterota bacterium]|nr:phosphatase PAP2 family protein [Candidatus Paceibacterota bacterium]
MRTVYVHRRVWKGIAYGTLGIFLILFFLVITAWTPLAQLDVAVVHFLATHRFLMLTDVALLATELGSFVVIATVGLTSTLFLLGARHHLATAFMATFFGSAATFGVIKFLVERTRPEDALAGYTALFSSFPSGHVSMATALYGALALVLTHHVSPKQHRFMYGGAITLILLVAWSRMYLGVHYPSDVLAGCMLGVFWIAIGKLVELEVIRFS